MQVGLVGLVQVRQVDGGRRRGHAQGQAVIGGNLGDDRLQRRITPGAGLLIFELVSQIGRPGPDGERGRRPFQLLPRRQ